MVVGEFVTKLEEKGFPVRIDDLSGVVAIANKEIVFAEIDGDKGCATLYLADNTTFWIGIGEEDETRTSSR